MRSPLIAMAWAMEKFSSTVKTFPFMRMRSAGACACAGLIPVDVSTSTNVKTVTTNDLAKYFIAILPPLLESLFKVLLQNPKP
jgi:hypothetical protein